MDINELINRINELARKQRSVGLSPEEKEEQAKVRQQYIEYIKGQVRASLEQVKNSDSNCSAHPHGNCNCHKH